MQVSIFLRCRFLSNPNSHFLVQVCKITTLFKVNGGWGDFGEWEECPVSCGGADRKRYRQCNNPVPENGGNDCTADGSTNVETERCNENPCPGIHYQQTHQF